MSRSLAITQRTQTCHTHHNGPTHPSQSLFKLYFESKLIVCYAFVIVKKMYNHKHDTFSNDFKNLQKRLYLCGTITLQLELRKHSYISNMASFLSLHECWTALVNPRIIQREKTASKISLVKTRQQMTRLKFKHDRLNSS